MKEAEILKPWYARGGQPPNCFHCMISRVFEHSLACPESPLRVKPGVMGATGAQRWMKFSGAPRAAYNLEWKQAVIIHSICYYSRRGKGDWLIPSGWLRESYLERWVWMEVKRIHGRQSKTRRHDWQEVLCGECWGHRHRGQGSWKGGLVLHQWSWDHDQELNQILWTRRATEDFEGVKLSDTCHRKPSMWQWRKWARNLIHQEAIKISRVELLRT